MSRETKRDYAYYEPFLNTIRRMHLIDRWHTRWPDALSTPTPGKNYAIIIIKAKAKL